MSAEKIEGEFNDFCLLNKKRTKIKLSKNKKKKNSNHNKEQKQKKVLVENPVIKKKNLEIVKQNIRHFFHIDWDNNIYYKESIKIGELINDYIYWSLINCSYFIEENIQEYPKKIKEEYLKIENQSINSYDVSTSTSNNFNILTNYNEKNKNLYSDNIYNNNIENNFRNKKKMNFIEIKNDKEYENKFNINNFEYNYTNCNLNTLKDKIKKHLYLINKLNKININKLGQKANELKEEFDFNNNIKNFNNSIKSIKPNLIYTKNELSLSIKNRFIEYLYNKEKNNLLKNDEIRENKIINNIKNDENEDEYMDLNTCSICNNCDLSQYQILYECEKCFIKVHSFCYGIKPTRSQKHWRCDKCKEMPLENSINLECILCPNKGGAMKKTNIPKYSELYFDLMNYRKSKVEFSQKNYDINISKKLLKEIECAWTHLSCALWNKNIKFGNFDSKKDIIIELNNFEKFNDLCHICHKNNYGPVVKCCENNCTFQCHPECARINKYYLEIEFTENLFKYNIYCHKHHPNKYAKIRNNMTRYNTEDIYEFDEELNKVFKIYEKYYKQEFYEEKKNENDLFEIPIRLNDSSDFEKISINSKTKVKKLFNIFNVENNKKNYTIYKKTHKNVLIQTGNIIEEDNNFINNKENYNNKFVINLNNAFESTKEENNSKSSKNNLSYMSLSNEINTNKPNNTSNDESFSSDNSMQSNKMEFYLSLEAEIKENKESFIIFLIGFLNDYFKNNRIILIKDDGNYRFSDDEEDNLLYEMNYEDLFKGEIPLNEIQYKDLPTSLIKKYLAYIFPNEEVFKELFIDKIDLVLNELKKNEKYINKEIYCKNGKGCIGNKDGRYKLLSIDQFKYQILKDDDIPNYFICYDCLNNIAKKK